MKCAEADVQDCYRRKFPLTEEDTVTVEEEETVMDAERADSDVMHCWRLGGKEDRSKLQNAGRLEQIMLLCVKPNPSRLVQSLSTSITSALPSTDTEPNHARHRAIDLAPWQPQFTGTLAAAATTAAATTVTLFDSETPTTLMDTQDAATSDSTSQFMLLI
jgi:hypothetical protein